MENMTQTELYDYIEDLLTDLNINMPGTPWGEIADEIEDENPGDAEILRNAEALWAEFEN